ncbi:phosphoribosyltransferase [Salinirubrum litoreum]|uniref:Phosphoribosyltransferase n=1 Tax=Salinirubrum litoreum TaxID=1126234 RepID=A0ABD5RDP6_9EURY|nr:phosphoribosyltransferase family protein [Salinirubrum litoreum]
MFTNRTEAGARLADTLADAGVEPDIVLAVPRGGLPVGRAVADRFGVPLDVVIAVKLGAPGNPELALGAVAGDGSVWLNGDLVAQLGVDETYLDRVRREKAETAREKVETYRDDGPLPDLAGKTVVVVDDGVATGATTRACLRQVRAGNAERVVLAVPVGSADVLAELRSEADDVIAVETPRGFGAVGAHYRDFRQVSDDEARSFLRE